MTCLLGVATATATGVVSGTTATAAAPRQCFAYLSAGSPRLITEHTQVLKSSPCVGISWTFPWHALEPAQGSYNWTTVDDALAATGSKPVILRVIGGDTAPSWLPRADGITAPNPKGGSTWMPIPWNLNFLAAW